MMMFNMTVINTNPLDRTCSYAMWLYSLRIILLTFREKTEERIIVIISDGDGDSCPWDDYYEKCPRRVQENLQKYSQAKEAALIHMAGIRVIYAVVGDLYKTSTGAAERVHIIAGGSQNIVPVASFTSFDTSVLDNMIKVICTPLS
ncbi:hypothetical protein RB195_011616 [Necator americanus]|uniref:VWFA domain-containing protein n=1 Tax=Necator americanus TaxID=51031 RepID=A0ABR1D3B9_NECAM